MKRCSRITLILILVLAPDHMFAESYERTFNPANLTLAADNVAPVLSEIEAKPLAYTENDAPKKITSKIKVTDADDADLISSVVSISVNYQNGEDVLSFIDNNGIQGTWNADAGVLSLSGQSSKANYQAALRSVRYFNSSNNPSLLIRTISFTVNDGNVNSLPVTRDIALTSVNDAPVAYSVTFRGSMIIESVLTGNYIYIDAEGDTEGRSTYKWFRANDISGTGEVTIPGATAKTYILTAADADKYISFEVKPVASSGTTTGIAVKSARHHVITLPSGWDVNPSIFSYKGLVTARVFKVEGIAVESGILAAFVGEECRGIIEATYHPAPDQYLFELSCYSNKLSGDVLTFRYYDPVEDTVYNMDRSVNFVPDMSAGTSESPVKMNIGVDFIVSFPVGWSWFSVNSFLDNMTPGFILSSVVTNKDYIKSQVGSATYYSGYGWFGSLKLIDTARLYKIQAQNSCITKFSGRPVDVSSTHLALVSGWNWIGYLPQVPMPVNAALSSLSLVDLDYLKNQKSSSTYYTGYGWFGSLTTLSPTEGYMLRLSYPGTLTYPDSGKKGNNTLEDDNELQFNPPDFEFNGSVTAKVLINGVPTGSENDLLFAYVNDEIRGVAVGLYFPPQDVWLYTLMIHSNLIEGEVVNFKYFDSEKNKYYTCKEIIIFSSDMIIADGFKPFELNVYGPYSNKGENIIQELAMHVYPNPFKHNITIEYKIPDLNHVRIAVCNIYGKPVTLLMDQKLESGHYLIQWESDAEPGGMYIIKLQAGERFKAQKVMLMP